MPCFADELLDPFYERLGSDYKNPARWRPGQIFWAPVPYLEEHRGYWRPANYDALTQTSAVDFRQVGPVPDLFNRPQPLHSPQLKSDEEFLVTRAKRRAVLLIATPPVVPAKLPLSHHPIVLPRFGLTKGASDTPKFEPAFLDRMRLLEFPSLSFSPSHPPHHSKDGFYRLDLSQPIPVGHLAPTDLAVARGPLCVLLAQLRSHLFGTYEDPYASLREMLLNQ